MDLIEKLKTKLDILINKYSELKEENKQLHAIIISKNETIALLNNRTIEIKNAAPDESDEKKNMQQQLDLIIADIDKILNTLDD